MTVGGRRDGGDVVGWWCWAWIWICLLFLCGAGLGWMHLFVGSFGCVVWMLWCLCFCLDDSSCPFVFDSPDSSHNGRIHSDAYRARLLRWLSRVEVNLMSGVESNESGRFDRRHRSRFAPVDAALHVNVRYPICCIQLTYTYSNTMRRTTRILNSLSTHTRLCKLRAGTLDSSC